MSFNLQYRPLCVIDIFHDFQLDESNKKFIDMNVAERKARLSDVNFSFEDFCDIEPCSETQQILDGHKMLIRKIGSSFTIMIRVDSNDNELPFVQWQPNKPLRFLIKLKDSLFFNYSNIVQESNQFFLFTNRNVIADLELASIDEDAILDNQAALKLMPLSSSNDYVDSSFLLNPINSRRYFKMLTSKEKAGLFGIIELHPLAANTGHSIVNHNEPEKLKAPANLTQFNLIFENRKTIWKYQNAVNKAVLYQTKVAHPLLKNNQKRDFGDGDFDVFDSNNLPGFYHNPSANWIESEGENHYSTIYVNN